MVGSVLLLSFAIHCHHGYCHYIYYSKNDRVHENSLHSRLIVPSFCIDTHYTRRSEQTKCDSQIIFLNKRNLLWRYCSYDFRHVVGWCFLYLDVSNRLVIGSDKKFNLNGHLCSHQTFSKKHGTTKKMLSKITKFMP